MYISAYSAIERAMFGEGEGSIWLDEVACSGSENELQDCAHNGVGINNCRHREDASVACVFGKAHIKDKNFSPCHLFGILLSSVYSAYGIMFVFS